MFERLGYHVVVTQTSGDFGADLIIQKDNVRTVVQAKRHSSRVGVSAIQEVVAAKAMFRAEAAVVVTNNFFTDQAGTLGQANGVELIDRSMLVRWLEQTKPE